MLKRFNPGTLYALAFIGWLCVAVESGAQSSRFPDELGAMPYDGGVTFRVWAPNASSVGVRGDFNSWNPTPMVSEGSSGYWSVDISGAQAGQEYMYFINNSMWRRDPRARQVVNSQGNSIIYDPDAFDWEDTPIPMPFRNDVVYYQMHLGTFGGQNPPSTFDQAISRLDHVQNLGINAIKLMPVNEFPGGRSWGYNPSDLFAIESDYGGPDAFKRFMKAAHERGIAVIMDVVHNHYGPSDLEDGLWEFDGNTDGDGGIYFYNDWRSWTPWGDTRPHLGRSEVRRFIRDNTFMFVEEYRIGGFRWDSVFNIINYGQEGPVTNEDGWHMLRDINWELLQDHPHVLRGSEDHAFDHPMNFEHQWDVGYRWDLHGQVVAGSDAERNMWTVHDLLANWASHGRVVFSEAHDYIAGTHGRSRIPTEIFGDEPESIWSRKRSLLAAGIVMTTPGIPMIFQGQEMLETQAFHDDTPLRWDRTNTFAGIVQAYTDMIHTRRNLRGGAQGLKGTGINVHHVDDDNKVIGYIRWDQGGGSDDVVVIANFANTRWTNSNYEVEFPTAGTWYSHFNSDDLEYAEDFDGIGATQVMASGNPPRAAVNMGRYSMQIFSLTPPDAGPPPEPGDVTIDPDLPDGCVPVTITYDGMGSPLDGAEQVHIWIGMNGWQGVVSTEMQSIGENLWEYTYTPAPGTEEINLVFHDGNPDSEVRIWDNNESADWHFDIINCEPGPSGLAITEPPEDIEVSYAISSFDLAGIAEEVEGEITWSNLLTGASGSFPATTPWSIPGVGLAVGDNQIQVSGWLPSYEIEEIGFDSSSNYGSGWEDGSNQGTGFGPWSFEHSQGSGFAGVFVGDPDDAEITGLEAQAFGFYANPFVSGARAEVHRDFLEPLEEGAVFSFLWGMNWDSDAADSFRGFILWAGETELVHIRMSDSSAMTLNEDPFLGAYGTTAMPVHFHYLKSGSIRVWGTGRNGTESFDETISVSAGVPTGFAFYFDATEAGEDRRQMYVDDFALGMEVAGDPIPVTDAVTITRAESDDADSNEDGVPDWWYEEHELDPETPGLADQRPEGSHFTYGELFRLDLAPDDTASDFRFEMMPEDHLSFIAPADGRHYRIQVADDLDDDFADLNSEALEPGDSVDLPVGESHRFFRLRFLPE